MNKILKIGGKIKKMKKIKKIVSLASASLLMGGLIFSAPNNTTIANAQRIQDPKYDKYYNEVQKPILRGSYQQRISLKTRHPQMLHKPYWSGMITIGEDGYLKMNVHETVDPNYKLDDHFMFLVFDSNLNIRFRFDTEHNGKRSANAELQDLVDEFNKLKVGDGNFITMVGKNWNGTALFDTGEENTSLIYDNWNNFSRGYSDNRHKWTTMLKVTKFGLVEREWNWAYFNGIISTKYDL